MGDSVKHDHFSSDELQTIATMALEAQLSPADVEDAKQAFLLFDKDGQGEIDRNEMEKVLARLGRCQGLAHSPLARPRPLQCC